MCYSAGRFLGALMEVVSRWHTSESAYIQVSNYINYHSLSRKYPWALGTRHMFWPQTEERLFEMKGHSSSVGSATDGVHASISSTLVDSHVYLCIDTYNVQYIAWLCISSVVYCIRSKLLSGRVY